MVTRHHGNTSPLSVRVFSEKPRNFRIVDTSRRVGGGRIKPAKNVSCEVSWELVQIGGCVAIQHNGYFVITRQG